MTIQEPPRLLYSQADAAKALGVSLATIKRAIGQGHIAVVRIGERCLIHKVELDRVAHDGIPAMSYT